MTIGPGDVEPSQFHGGEAPGVVPRPRNPSDVRPARARRIFGLYGRKVAAGEWRDYAIDSLRDRAVFSVFAVPAKSRSTASRRARAWRAARAPIA